MARRSVSSNPRIDDPTVTNQGTGPVAYADRGAFEYAPVVPATTLDRSPPRDAAVRTDGADLRKAVWPNLMVQPNPAPRGHGALSFR